MKRIKARHPLDPSVKLPAIYISEKRQNNIKNDLDKKLDEAKTIITEIKTRMKYMNLPPQMQQFISKKELEIEKKRTLKDAEKAYKEMKQFRDAFVKQQKEYEKKIRVASRQQGYGEMNQRKPLQPYDQKQLKKKYSKKLNLKKLRNLIKTNNKSDIKNLLLDMYDEEIDIFHDMADELGTTPPRSSRVKHGKVRFYDKPDRDRMPRVDFEDLRSKMFINRINPEAIGYKMNMMIVQDQILYSILPLVHPDVFVFSDPAEKEIIMKVLDKWMEEVIFDEFGGDEGIEDVIDKYGSLYVPLAMLLDQVGPVKFKEMVTLKYFDKKAPKKKLIELSNNLRNVRPVFKSIA